MPNHFYLVVLAAGKGTRINATDKPKVMFPLNGQPMIGLFVPIIGQLKPTKTIFVIGFHGQQVIDYLTQFGKYDYVWQKEQLGTGHAALQSKSILKGKEGITIIINGDNPLFSVITMQRMAQELRQQQAVLAISAAKLDPVQFPYGRIVRDKTGHVTRVVEAKNCSPLELRIPDLNAGLYVADNIWLMENLPKIKPNSVSQEYYITDLVEIANTQGERVIAVEVGAEKEAIGINTLENLQEAQQALDN